MVNWEKLKTEYVTTHASYKELSEKYQVPYGTLKIHARCDRWVELRQEHQKKTMEKSLEIIGNQQAEDLARVDELADQLLGKIQKSIGELDLLVVSHKEKGENQSCKWEKSFEEHLPGGPVDRQGLKSLTACLRDLKEIKDLKSDLEEMEQKLKVRKLQKETEENGPESLNVTLDPQLESFSQ